MNRCQHPHVWKLVGRDFQEFAGILNLMNLIEYDTFCVHLLKEMFRICQKHPVARKVAVDILSILPMPCQTGPSNPTHASEPNNRNHLPRLLDSFHPKRTIHHASRIDISPSICQLRFSRLANVSTQWQNYSPVASMWSLWPNPLLSSVLSVSSVVKPLKTLRRDRRPTPVQRAMFGSN